MATYVGLTDDPVKRRVDHGSPQDWRQIGPFPNQDAARAWEKQELTKPNTRGGPGGAGWRYGYWYTITARTVQ